MALYTVTQNGGINAQDVQQIIAELQKTTGTQEVENYLLAGGLWTTSPTLSYISLWITLRSRNATPVSVTVDTGMQAPHGSANSPQVGQFSQSGFQLYCNGFGLAASSGCGGTYTVSF